MQDNRLINVAFRWGEALLNSLQDKRPSRIVLRLPSSPGIVRGPVSLPQDQTTPVSLNLDWRTFRSGKVRRL